MRETVCNKKMFMVTASLCVIGALTGGFAYAGELPGGGEVIDGNVHIYQRGDTLNIDQSTDKAIISWENFSVGKDNIVNFNQPSSDSATLNRVTGDFTSEIAGQINANGSVFLVNPNGILITADGVIDTGNFVASTLDIDNNDFLKGDYAFTKDGDNGVVANQGRISVDDGGFVALLGGAVKNDGFVRAHVGTVGFAGGEKIVMSFGNNDFLRVEVPTDKWEQLTDSQGNKVSATLDLGGKIESRGGFVDITVADASDILRQSISVSGIVSANTVSSTDGVISISGGTLGIAGNGRITADADYGNAGRIDVAVQSLNMSAPISATAATGNGGTIKVSLQQGASLSRGAVLDVSGKQGGSVSVIGGLSGDKYYKVVGSGDVIADGSDGTGGYIDISNKNGLVGLFSGSISAKGTTMGGRIRIGGAFQGGSYNAETSSLDKKTQHLFVHRWSDSSGLTSAGKTSLGTGVHIDASSESSMGGTVVLWADHTTNNYAQITATGGTGGGAVEISGKKKVDSFGLKRVEVGNGVLLLDPKNVVIGKFADGLSQAKRIMSTTPLMSPFDLDDNDNFGVSVALSEDGSKLAVGARGDDTGAPNNGAVYLFTVGGTKSSWGSVLSQEYKIAYGSGLNVKQGNAQFGKSVAFNDDGTKLVVGMPFVDKASSYRKGKGRIFFFSVDWGKSVAGNSYLEYGGNGYFGTGVALSDDGTKLAVGESGDNTGNKGDADYVYQAGSVSLFVLSGDGKDWQTSPYRQRTARIVNGTGGLSLSAYDAFGYSVALSGDGSRLAVGAEGTDSNRGAVHLFTVGGSTWGKAVSHISKIGNGSVTEDGTQLKFNKRDFFGGGVTLSDDGTKLAVGAIYDDTAGQNLGAVYLFTVGGTTWGGKVALAGKITDGAGVSLSSVDKFGYSVALNTDGSRLVVGAVDDDSHGNNAGTVYLFNVASTTWGSTVTQAIKLSHGAFVLGTFPLDDHDYFGSSVSLSGDGTKLAVGAHSDDDGGGDRGAVYLFTVTGSGSTWGSTVTQAVKLSHGASLSSGTISLDDEDYFGSGVSLNSDGTQLAVGATGDDDGGSSRGAVYLYTVDGSGATWGSTVTQAVKLSDSHASVSLDNWDYFGSSVSLGGDGTKLAVGAVYDGDEGNYRGAVYLFTVAGSSSTWGSTVTQVVKLSHGASLSSGTVSLDNWDEFGSSVWLSSDGTQLAVGAKYDDDGGSDRGAVYLYTVGGSGATWGNAVTQAVKLSHGASLSSGTVSLDNGDRFGSGVSLSGDGTKLAVGAESDDDGGSNRNANRGAVYLFTVAGSGSTWGSTITQVVKLSHGKFLSSGTVSLGNDNYFGRSVSLSSDGAKLAVGAYLSDDGGKDRGATYLYTIGTSSAAGATWGSKVTQAVKLSHGASLLPVTVSPDNWDMFGRSVSLSGDGTKLAVGAYLDDDGGSSQIAERGAVYLYTIGTSSAAGVTWGSTVTQVVKLSHGASLSSGTVSLDDWDMFGSSVSLNSDGTKLAVGTPRDDSGGSNQGADRGAVYLYTVGGSGWGSTVTQVVKLSHGASLSSGTVSLDDDDEFGSSVSLNGDGTQLAVGAPYDDDGGLNRGAVYLYTVGGSSWGRTVTQAVKLSDSYTSVSLDDGDEFGSSVSLSGNGTQLAVGAPRDDDGGIDRGAVYLYTVGGSSWGRTVTQAVKLSDSHASVSLDSDDRFGKSVSLSGNGTQLAVGALRDDDGGRFRGAVYLYTVGGFSWGRIVTQAVKLSHGAFLSSGTISLADWDEFGISVSLSADGTKLAIGATGDDDGGINRGAVYLYIVGGSSATWGSAATQTHTEFVIHNVALTLTKNETFGSAVAISDDGKKLAVGAQFNDTGGTDRGAVYLFELGGGDSFGDDVYYTAKIADGNGVSLDNGDKFGAAVALNNDGSTLVVGAPKDDTNGTNFGAVYVLSVGGVAWGDTVAQLGKLASNTAGNFGDAVAVSGDGTKLAVGIPKNNAGGTRRGAVRLYTIENSGNAYSFKPQATYTHGSVLESTTLYLRNSEQFGYSVALSGDGFKLAVGAIGYDGYRGRVYLFALKGKDTSWGITPKKVGEIRHGDAGISLSRTDYFGGAVALSKDGNKLAVGAHGDSTGGRSYGAVYIFSVGGSAWGNTITKNYKIAHDSGVSLAPSGQFGWALALSGDGKNLVVGAPRTNGALVNEGAIYLLNLSKDTVSPITEKLKTGTNIHIVASNDITVDDDIVTTAGTGKLTLIAGRSIKINSDVKINGGLTLTANDASDSSFVLSDRDTARAEITVAAGKTVSGGGGDLLIEMRTGNSNAPISTKQTGKITVWKADGARVSIVHLGAVDAHNDAEIVIRSGGQITATGDHDKGDVVIELAAERFTNNSDSNALKIADSNGDKGRYLIWTLSSADTHLNGIVYDFSKNNVTYDSAKGDFQANPITAADGNNEKYKSGVLYRVRDSRQSRLGYDGSSSKTKSALTLSDSGNSSGSGAVNTGTILLGASAILLGGSVIATTSVASVDNIFTTGIYAHLRGIDMQAIYQLPTETKTPRWASVFNTPQAAPLKYKVKYTTTYDMAFLAHNIKAQKAIPFYELDEKLYETIKRIFVQQSAPTHKTAGIDTKDTAPA